MAATSRWPACCKPRCCAVPTPTPASSPIDTSKAEAYPGVKAVITGKDLPLAGMENPGRGMRFSSENILAQDKALYRGHAVAAVAAVNPHVAEIAVGLSEVEYEVLPPVINVTEAMKDEAPLVIEDMTTTELGERTDKLSNVATHFRYELGDVDRGFGEADVVVERSFIPPRCTRATLSRRTRRPCGTPTAS